MCTVLFSTISKFILSSPIVGVYKVLKDMPVSLHILVHLLNHMVYIANWPFSCIPSFQAVSFEYISAQYENQLAEMCSLFELIHHINIWQNESNN